MSGRDARAPVATNLVAAMGKNIVPGFFMTVVQVPVTNLIARPEADAGFQATDSFIKAFAPGIGSIVAQALGRRYHRRRQVRNRKVNGAPVQGGETAGAVLATTLQQQAADAQFVK